MKLKDVRKTAIKYCEENNCKYTYISYNDTDEFYLTESENKHTVFYVNRNGSLNACRNTKYAVDFHKELRRRKKIRNKNGKKEIAHIANRDSIDEDSADEEDE